MTVTVTNFAVAGESLCDRFRSNVADMSLSLDVNGLLLTKEAMSLDLYTPMSL